MTTIIHPLPVRSTAPETSYEAAVGIQSDVQRDRKLATDQVAKHPGSTAGELDDKNGTPQGVIRKRLKECVREGTVHRRKKRKCTVTGNNAFTNWPGPAGPAVHQLPPWVTATHYTSQENQS